MLETFCDATAALRTDDSSRARRDPKHHNGESPLESIGTGMVSLFRLDPFHLINIGVLKRFVEWKEEISGFVINNGNQ